MGWSQFSVPNQKPIQSTRICVVVQLQTRINRRELEIRWPFSQNCYCEYSKQVVPPLMHHFSILITDYHWQLSKETKCILSPRNCAFPVPRTLKQLWAESTVYYLKCDSTVTQRSFHISDQKAILINTEGERRPPLSPTAPRLVGRPALEWSPHPT